MRGANMSKCEEEGTKNVCIEKSEDNTDDAGAVVASVATDGAL